MWPSRIVILVITLCVSGCLCLTRTKRAALTGVDNPYDLRAALRVLERERRRLELQAIEPLPKREMKFEQQPVIVDSPNDDDDDPDVLDRLMAEKGDSIFYDPDQAKDVQSLLREIDEGTKSKSEAVDGDFQAMYDQPLSDTEMDIDQDSFPYVSEKIGPVKKKAVPGKRPAKKRLDLMAGKRSAQTLKTVFNNLTPEEIHKLLLLEDRLQTKEVKKRQRKVKPVVVDIRSQPNVDLEDDEGDEDVSGIPITKEELDRLMQGEEEFDQSENSNDIDDGDQMNEIIQAESDEVDPRMDQPVDSDIFKSAIQDLATLQMLQEKENEKRTEEQDAVARWDPAEMNRVVPVVIGAVPDLTESRNDGRKKRYEAAAKIEPSIELSTKPSLAEMMAKLWIKHKLEGIEIDYLADALNAATMSQSGASPEASSVPIEIDSLQKAIRIEKLMKELGSTDEDIEKDGVLDQLALKYLQRHQLRPEDAGITLRKKSSFDDELEAEAAALARTTQEQEEQAEEEEEEVAAAETAAREQEREREQEEEDYRNNLLRGDDDEDGELPLLYEIPDNKINQIAPLPRPDYRNRIPYQLMDMPENSEDEDSKDDDVIPLSQDIGLLNTEDIEPDETDESLEPSEKEESEVGLSPEEAQSLGAETSLRNMLKDLDTEDRLRNQESSESEEETEEALYYQQEKEKCPILKMSKDCQFADMLNIRLNGRKRDLCNRHEMCYNCGTTIGLGPSLCDRGFLADSIKECNGNLSCIRLADIFLRLMRVTHTFSTLPNKVCNVSCVRDYVIGL